MQSTLVFLTSLFLSVSTIAAISPLAVRFGLVDKPGGHKRHEHHTPLVGGIAIYLSLALAWFLAPLLGLGTINPMFIVAGSLVFVIGLIDDRIQLSVKLRFGIQLIAAAMLVYSGVMVLDVGALLSAEPLTLGMLALPVTVVAILGAINAMNMIDGVDGLAGLVGLATFGLLGVVAYIAGAQPQLLMLLCAIGSISGFLVFNMPINGRARASVFMGDAGSTLLGFLLAYLLISLSQGESRAMTPVVALWIFAVPLLDTLGVMLRRMWLKKSPFSADRGHIHHLLLDAGFRVRQAVVIIAAVQLMMGATGIAAYYLGVPDVVSLGAFGLVLAGHVYLVSRPWRIVPRFRALHGKTGLTVRGVKQVFVGNLDSATASADIEALLGNRAHLHDFQIHRAGEGANHYIYATIDAGQTDEVIGLLAYLKRKLAVITVVDPTSHLCGAVIRQYIPRKQENDRRSESGSTAVIDKRRTERRRLPTGWLSGRQSRRIGRTDWPSQVAFRVDPTVPDKHVND